MTDTIESLQEALKEVREHRTRAVRRAGEAELKLVSRDREIQRLTRVIRNVAEDAEKGGLPRLAMLLRSSIDG